jgi:hypothetical protein
MRHAVVGSVGFEIKADASREGQHVVRELLTLIDLEPPCEVGSEALLVGREGMGE